MAIKKIKTGNTTTITDEILKQAKVRYELGLDQWSEYYRESKSILKFIDGDQWDYQIRQNRSNAGLPVLTANSLPTFLRHITNEARKNTPAIQIDPKDDEANQDTAQVFADLCRGIEQHSNASTAYDNASWYAAACGLGFLRVVTEYEDDDSFLQKLVIKTISDPSTVIIDPDHKLLDGSDAEWCFITTQITKEEYKRLYSKSKMAIDSELHGWTSNDAKWVREDEVTIAEYYWKDYSVETLYQIFDNHSLQQSTTTVKPSDELIESGLVSIINQRPIDKVTIRWAKINDVEILEETTWPGTMLPVVAVKGDESWYDGKRHVKGAVKDAVDSQRALNYFFSLQAELVSMAPKAPWVGEIRQFAGFENLWRDANIATSAYLPYNAVQEGGQLLSPPQRNTAEVAIQAATSLCNQARDNLKAIFGIYDASLGQNGNETSGIAILSRTEQAHTTNYHFYDNLVKSIQQIGNILIEVIPTYYAEERTVQLIKQNGEAQAVKVNGADSEHNLGTGKYGVVVETGPSYATRRQDSVTHMIALGEAYPQALPLIADIIANESDWPGSKQVAARLRMALPPEIQQQEAATGNGITPAQQAQMAVGQLKQLQAQMQQLQQHTTEVENAFKNSFEENKLLKLKQATDLKKVELDTNTKEKQLMLDELTTELEYKLKMAELKLQERQLDIQESQLSVKVLSTAHDMNVDHHEQTVAHVSRINMPEPSEIGNTESDSHEIGGNIDD